MSERATEASPEALEAELEPLLAEGAAGFDPGGVRTIRSLIAALDRVPASARARLVERARDHVARLRARLDARTRALRGAIEGLDETRRPTEEALRDALVRGRFLELAWTAVRGARAGAIRRVPTERLRARLEAALADRGRAADASIAPGAPAAVDPLALSERLYRDSVAETITELEVRRASLPPAETTGIYHGSAIAARAIEAMGALHRPYLRAQLGRLEALAALEAFAAEMASSK